ncbi:MAG: MnhB domain-containing protein [Pseudobdellovibrionaceae bacterium]
MISSVLFKSAEKLIFWILIGLAAFFLLRGHNAPGGGFIAALIVFCALILRQLAHDPKIQMNGKISPAVGMSIGLVLALGSALIGVLENRTFMQGVWIEVLGIQVGTPLIFDIGIFCTVLGALRAFFIPLLRED